MFKAAQGLAGRLCYYLGVHYVTFSSETIYDETDKLYICAAHECRRGRISFIRIKEGGKL